MPLRVSRDSSSVRSRRRVPSSRSIGSGAAARERFRRWPAHRSRRTKPISPYPTAVGSKITARISRYGLTESSLRPPGTLFKSGMCAAEAISRRTMNTTAKGPRWWQGATLYQIYVRSWRDADSDGYGDLRGVIDGLDYLRWLGVDGIWLSPTMPSPDKDW